MSKDRHINFKILRDRILVSDKKSGPEARVPREYWRSLEELADSPILEEFIRREFPQHAEEWNDAVERRTFLKLMGASLALAGLSGCVIQPPEKIVPYVKQPEEEVPGKGLYFATAFSLGGIATPLLARSNEGRPTKLEGNPDHPNNRNSDPNDKGSSATDIFSQASILTLYDPDRSQTPLYRGETRPWTQFMAEIRGLIEKETDGLKAKKGAGLRFLTETITSPSLAAQMKSILTDFPEAKWHQYEPANRDNARAGAVMAFGQPVNTIYDFSKADRILSLGSDFLACQPGSLRYARDYAAKRRISGDKTEMNRLYVVESTPTTTGANADHRFSVRPSELETISVKFLESIQIYQMLSLTNERTAKGSAKNPASSVPPRASLQPDNRLVDAIARDLFQNKGESLVIVGDEQPPIIHALGHAINAALGNVGKTVFYTDPVEASSVDQTQSLRELVSDIDAGRVETLIMIGGNAAYNTPADLRLDFNRLNRVKLRAHLSLYNNETSELCHWHIPAAHYLESWSDARSYDGTATIVQPLIAPLYEGKTAHEVLALFSDNYDRKPYDIVRDYWRTQAGGRVQGIGGIGGSQNELAKPSAAPVAEVAGDFESWWRKCLHDGFVPNSALPAKTVSLKSDWASALSSSNTQPPKPNTLEVVFRADPSIYDGRFANNGWLQELPKPLTKLTWDNVALVSPNTAKKIGVAPQNYEQDKKGREAYVDTIEIKLGGRAITKAVPAWVMPGQPDDVITIHLGYGRERAGRVGNGQGFNAYEIRASDAPWFATGAQVTKASGQYQLATTQVHF